MKLIAIGPGHRFDGLVAEEGTDLNKWGIGDPMVTVLRCHLMA